jgi:hypothetical protein
LVYIHIARWCTVHTISSQYALYVTNLWTIRPWGGLWRCKVLLVCVPRKTWKLLQEIYVIKCRKESTLSSTPLTRILFTLNYARERLVFHPSHKHTTVIPVLNGIFLQQIYFQYFVVPLHAGFTVFRGLHRHVRKGQTQNAVSWCRRQG